MARLLRYLDNHKYEQYVVIFDDLKRFARDTVFHLKLRQELKGRDAIPECLNFTFEDTPEGEFVETILAAQAELERKQNRRQVVSRMQARLTAGYWVFCPPIGYTYAKQNHEKILVPDPPDSEYIKAALEGFARGEFRTQIDVQRFLQARNCKSRWSRGDPLSITKIERVLRNEMYSGWCVSATWNIRVRGRHEPLISEETHRQVMERLNSASKTVIRKDARPEFPLRGHVRCGKCGVNLTACWAQGRSAKYPYYRCLTKGCIGSIRTHHMEESFLERLHKATPRGRLLRLFESQLARRLSNQEKIRDEQMQVDERRIEEIDQEIGALVDSVARTPMPSVRKIFEGKIAFLQEEKEQLETRRGIIPDFFIEPVLEKGHEFLKDPAGSWQNGDLARRRMVQELAFEPPIIFDPKLAYRTATFSLFYRICEQSKHDNSHLVDLLDKNLHPVAEEFHRWMKIFKKYSG